MSPDRTAPVTPRRWLRGIFALGLLLLAGWLLRAPILTAAARYLIVSDPLPEKADAIIVLGGGMNFRPTEAARLYHLGVAPKILVTHPVLDPPVDPALVPPEGELAAALLEKLDVPPQSIERLPEGVTSTHEEALVVRAWLRNHPCQRLLIPTDEFRTRRTQWVFEKVLAGTGVAVSIHGLDPVRYSATNWWQREEGLKTFQSEVTKLLYYRLRY